MRQPGEARGGCGALFLLLDFVLDRFDGLQIRRANVAASGEDRAVVEKELGELYAQFLPLQEKARPRESDPHGWVWLYRRRV